MLDLLVSNLSIRLTLSETNRKFKYSGTLNGTRGNACSSCIQYLLHVEMFTPPLMQHCLVHLVLAAKAVEFFTTIAPARPSAVEILRDSTPSHREVSPRWKSMGIATFLTKGLPVGWTFSVKFQGAGKLVNAQQHGLSLPRKDKLPTSQPSHIIANV